MTKNNVWVLSTSEEDVVTSRSMSIINVGLNIYFQTNKCYIKHNQMNKNKNVALCCNNVSIEGSVKEIGNWLEEKNFELLELYIKKHPSSFEAYGLLEGQVLYQVEPKKIKYWKYVEGTPLREIMYIDEKRAERLAFM